MGRRVFGALSIIGWMAIAWHPAMATEASTNDAWSWRFALGIGYGVASVDGPPPQNDGASAVGMAWLGFPVSHRFLLGMQGDAWEVSNFAVSASTISASYFLTDSFSLHAGAGVGSLEEGKGSVTTTRHGSALLVAGTFEFPTGRSVRVGPGVRYIAVSTDDLDARYWALALTFTWRSPGE